MPLIGDCTIDYKVCPVGHIARAGVENRKPCTCVSVYDFPCVTAYEDRERERENTFLHLYSPFTCNCNEGRQGDRRRGGSVTLYVTVIKTSGTA